MKQWKNIFEQKNCKNEKMKNIFGKNETMEKYF